MIRLFRVPTAAVAAAVAFALMTASPAQADESAYLAALQPKYTYLNAHQLLDEGHKVCRAIANGMISPDAVSMVYKDMSVSMAVADDIVATAAVDLGC
jgi:hypothetical protein